MVEREEVEEKEKESVIQKRRSLHSGHVWRRHALYGAITYALLSGRGGGREGAWQLLRFCTARHGWGGKKSGGEEKGTGVGYTSRGGDMILQFK